MVRVIPIRKGVIATLKTIIHFRMSAVAASAEINLAATIAGIRLDFCRLAPMAVARIAAGRYAVMSTANDGFVHCYHCRAGKHVDCVGIPCQCECPNGLRGPLQMNCSNSDIETRLNQLEKIMGRINLIFLAVEADVFTETQALEEIKRLLQEDIIEQMETPQSKTVQQRQAEIMKSGERYGFTKERT